MAKHRKTRNYSPAELSMAIMRRWGYDCGMVERFISARKIRIDLFNIIDIVCMKEVSSLPGDIAGMPGQTIGGIVGVQCCELGDYFKHIRKYDDPVLHARIIKWCKAGGRYVIHAWGSRGKGEDRVTCVKVSEAIISRKGLRWEEEELQYKSRNPGNSKEDPL